MGLNLQIIKVENGFIVHVGGDTSFISRDFKYVFTDWDSAVDFISTLNDRFK